MFYVIKDDTLFEYGDNVNRAWEYPLEAQELEGIDIVSFEENRDKYAIIDGVLCDISQTDDYLNKKSAAAKELQIQEIKDKLAALDLKCIRALREGGEDDDGTSYLKKYQDEINTLRTELQTLE